ncbi:MAG TPA: Ig-like domain-containing protein [Streptosporangiaceae bacterium]|nr:Ig-like domain-containing protein [Streptosporangiaceae bacterium]
MLSITPADGSRGIKTSAAVTVTAVHAQVSSITVTSGGAPVEGMVSEGGTVWHSRWALHTSSTYRVTATGRSASGKTVSATSSFRTITPSATMGVHIFQGDQQTYGVGMPIILTFNGPVTRKAAVEAALEVTTSKPVAGAWYWDGDQTLYFRPRAYWPQNTQVNVTGHFDGVQAARGVYGTADLTQHFRIGASLIVSVNTRTHYMKVWYRHHLIGTWPVSTGRPGYDTPNGTYLTIEKGNPTRMVGSDYDLLVPYAVRFTWSGMYIHAADWSVAQQGIVNVSHGCVNVSPAHAETYYRLARGGDPVTVTGSPAAGTWGDGWTVWFWTWHQLMRGSALNKAVVAGPDGSRFVSPSSLGPWSPSSPLQGPEPGSYHAGSR